MTLLPQSYMLRRQDVQGAAHGAAFDRPEADGLTSLNGVRRGDGRVHEPAAGA